MKKYKKPDWCAQYFMYEQKTDTARFPPNEDLALPSASSTYSNTSRAAQNGEQQNEEDKFEIETECTADQAISAQTLADTPLQISQEDEIINTATEKLTNGLVETRNIVEQLLQQEGHKMTQAERNEHEWNLWVVNGILDHGFTYQSLI